MHAFWIQRKILSVPSTWSQVQVQVLEVRVQLQYQVQQEHSESANLRQHQNFNQKSPGNPIRIFGLIRIRMSVGSVLKCRRCIILSASNVQKFPIPQWRRK